MEPVQPSDSLEFPGTSTFESSQAARLVRVLAAEGDELSALLREADPDLLRGALRNPQLSESQILTLLRRPKLNEGVIRGIQRAPQTAGNRRIRVALAGHPATPPPLLAELLGQLHLLELAEVMRLPGASADHKAAAQQAILKRLPDSELGIKITLARRCAPAILEALLAEGEARLVSAVLANPTLGESNLLGHFRSPAASPETISAILRHPRWGVRPKLRQAALDNRKTPPVWFTLFLPALSTR